MTFKFSKQHINLIVISILNYNINLHKVTFDLLTVCTSSIHQSKATFGHEKLNQTHSILGKFYSHPKYLVKLESCYCTSCNDLSQLCVLLSQYVNLVCFNCDNLSDPLIAISIYE